MIGTMDKSEFKPRENYEAFYVGHKFEPFPEGLALKADEVVPRVAWALDVAKEIEAKYVLDLCCLDGFASLTLADKLATSVIGVDLSKPGIDLANKRAEKAQVDAVYLQAPVENIDITGRPKFDLVLLFEAIEHFTNPDVVMDTIKANLRHGGTLLVSTPDAQGHFGIRNVEDICHLRVYTTLTDGSLPGETPEGKPIVSLPNYLEEHGFKVVQNEVWNELIHVRATF